MQEDIAKREERPGKCSPTQPKWKCSIQKGEKVITVTAGDFNTDPTDPRFALEQTFSLLRHNFEWTWEGVPLPERVTLPAEGRYPRRQLRWVPDSKSSGSCLQGGSNPRSQ